MSDKNKMEMEMETETEQSDAVVAKNKSQHDETSSSPTDEEEVETCPLFMDGLPSDFSSNPALAAIASLLDADADDDDADDADNGKKVKEIEKTMPTGKEGGGKVRRQGRTHTQTNRNPYNIPEKKKKTTMGEAQLFLNMWKI